MSRLPKLSEIRPTYELILPTTKEKIKYSCIKNKELEALLIAAQENDFSALIATHEKILEICADIVPKSIIDFIYLVTHIRAKTTGGYHSFILTECDCGHKNINIEIEDILENISIKNENNVKDIYNITDKIALRLVPTKYEFLKEIKFEDTISNQYKQIHNLIAHSVDYVVNDKDIIKDFTIEELKEDIIYELTPLQKQEINKKIGDMINMVLKYKYTCPECKKEYEKEISNFLF